MLMQNQRGSIASRRPSAEICNEPANENVHATELTGQNGQFPHIKLSATSKAPSPPLADEP